jgi:protein-S-isoprenylcysteine O-methyltransferase Ste14
MADDGQDTPGIWVPPPLVYLLALLLGLLLNRRAYVPFVPRGVARALGWPLVGGGMALAAWFVRTMHGADTTLRTDKPVSRVVQDGPFRYSRNPGYLALTMLYAGIAVRRNALWMIVMLPLVVYVIQLCSTRRSDSRRRTLSFSFADNAFLLVLLPIVL